MKLLFVCAWLTVALLARHTLLAGGKENKILSRGGQMSDELRDKLKQTEDELAQLKGNADGRVSTIKAEEDDKSLNDLIQNDEPTGSATKKLKRSNSTSSETSSKQPPSKRAKASNMLANQRSSFTPTANPEDYIPLSLITGEISSKNSIEIPVMMRFSEGEACELTYTRNTKEDDRNF